MPIIKHTIPQLPYGYGDLDPHIGSETMRLHHQKHHKAYCDKLNELLADEPSLVELDIEKLIVEVGSAENGKGLKIRNNAGGVFNHQIWWPMMTPNPDKPRDMLSKMIEESFGNIDGMKSEFFDSCSDSFGSSWVWLVVRNKTLDIVQTKMQDNPLGLGIGYPVLGCDLWEHAYYLDRRNRKNDWVENFWKVVNWKEVENRILMSEGTV